MRPPCLEAGSTGPDRQQHPRRLWTEFSGFVISATIASLARHWRKWRLRNRSSGHPPPVAQLLSCDFSYGLRGRSGQALATSSLPWQADFSVPAPKLRAQTSSAPCKYYNLASPTARQASANGVNTAGSESQFRAYGAHQVALPSKASSVARPVVQRYNSSGEGLE